MSKDCLILSSRIQETKKYLFKKIMNEELLDEIGQMAEGIDNVLFGYQNMKQLPDRIHLTAMSAKLEEVRDKLAEIYKKNGGTEELNIQA